MYFDVIEMNVIQRQNHNDSRSIGALPTCVKLFAGWVALGLMF